MRNLCAFVFLLVVVLAPTSAQEPVRRPSLRFVPAEDTKSGEQAPNFAKDPAGLSPPAPQALDQAYPINLPTALRLAKVQPLDIAIAEQRLEAAAAQFQRARAQWLP